MSFVLWATVKPFRVSLVEPVDYLLGYLINNMQTLKSQLEKLISSLSVNDRDKVKNRLDDLISVYPFNEYESLLSNKHCNHTGMNQ